MQPLDEQLKMRMLLFDADPICVLFCLFGNDAEEGFAVAPGGKRHVIPPAGEYHVMICSRTIAHHSLLFPTCSIHHEHPIETIRPV